MITDTKTCHEVHGLHQVTSINGTDMSESGFIDLKFFLEINGD